MNTMVEMAPTMCSRRCHPMLVMLFCLPTLFVKGHGTKESVTGLLGWAGDGEGAGEVVWLISLHKTSCGSL